MIKRIKNWFKDYQHEKQFRGWFMPIIMDLPFYYKVNNFYWAIRHRTINRYHVLKTGLGPGWTDIHTRVLYANFNQLKDWVDEMTTYDSPAKGVEAVKAKIEQIRANWNEDKLTGWDEREPNNRYDYAHELECHKEALRLYDWWINVFPKYEDNSPWNKNFERLYEQHKDRRTVKEVGEDGQWLSYMLDDSKVPENIREERRKNTLDTMMYEVQTMKETDDNHVSLVKILRYLYD